MARYSHIILLSVSFGPSIARGDDLIYRYDGDVLPWDPSAGFLIDSCAPDCVETVEDGGLVIRWEQAPEFVQYFRWFGDTPDDAPPAPFWAEWRFRSTQHFASDPACDASFVIGFRHVVELIDMLGDAAVSFSGNEVRRFDPIGEPHSYRLESPDGISFCFWIDGTVYFCRTDQKTGTYAYLAMYGRGDCGPGYFPVVNEWDFVRYGTISYGESIAAVDPPGPATGGFIDARTHAALDRFTVTFDQPNYVYVDEIAVETTTGVAPSVTATRRRDNGPPETVEIVLSHPIPYNATTHFTFNDGKIEQTVELTYAPGDTDGDGDADLADLAAFQNCFGESTAGTALTHVCPVFDFNTNDRIEDSDFAAFQPLMAGQ